MKIERWAEVEAERLGEDVERQIIWGVNANLTRFVLASGAHVQAHSHRAEQFSCVLEGALRLRIDGDDHILRPGDMLVIPAGVAHEAWADEPAVVLDFFAPAREDWRAGRDGYLTGAGSNANTKKAVT